MRGWERSCVPVPRMSSPMWPSPTRRPSATSSWPPWNRMRRGWPDTGESGPSRSAELGQTLRGVERVDVVAHDPPELLGGLLAASGLGQDVAGDVHETQITLLHPALARPDRPKERK